MNQSPNGFTKGQELIAARALAKDPSRVWSDLVEWARKGLAAPQRLKEDRAFFSRAIVCASYLEFEMDRCRPEAERLLADIRIEGVNPATIVARIYDSLNSRGRWNTDVAPDIPDLFFSRQCGPQEHPMGTLRKCLCWLALGRVATEVIYHIHADSPLGTRLTYWIFKDDPPVVLEGKLTLGTSTPFREILRGDFPKYKRNLDDTIEDIRPAWNVDELDEIQAGQEGLVEAKETWSKKHISKLLIAIQSGGLVRSLQAIISNTIAEMYRERSDFSPVGQRRLAEWRKVLKKYQPKGKLARAQLKDEFNKQWDKTTRRGGKGGIIGRQTGQDGITGLWGWDSEESVLEEDFKVVHDPTEFLPLYSLDYEYEDEDGNPYTLLDEIPAPESPGGERSGFDSFERERLLEYIINKAGLNERESIVYGLNHEGMSKRQIALELARVFGKLRSEGNVREILCRARKKVERAGKELTEEEINDIRDLYS